MYNIFLLCFIIYFLPCFYYVICTVHLCFVSTYSVALFFLLTAQQVPPMENLLSLSDAEDLLNDSTLTYDLLLLFILAINYCITIK